MVTTKLNLSMTEPSVRQIYAKQGDTGRVLDISLDQTPEDGTLRILRPDGVEVTSEAVTGGEVESGETVTFDSMTEADVTELTAEIEPIQFSLPSGYQAIEYIQSTGHEYINTGFVPTSNDGFEIDFISNNDFVSSGNYGCILGARTSSSTLDFQLTTWTAGERGTVRWGTGLAHDAGLLDNGARQKAKLYQKTYTAPNGSTWSFTSNYTGAYPIYVFSLNQAGSATQNGSVILYSLKLYRGADLAMYLIPCKRTSDNKLGLYDVVGGTFLPVANIDSSANPQGGGNVTLPNPTNPLPITGHDEVRVTRTGKNLLPFVNSTVTNRGVTAKGNSDGTYSWIGTATSNTALQFNVNVPITNGVYRFVSNVGAIPGVGNITLYCYDKTGTLRVLYNGDTIDLSSYEIKKIAFFTQTGKSVNYPSVELMLIQESETDTAFEPYQGSTYITSLGQTVYGGTLDMVTGVLTVDRAMVSLSGSDLNIGSGTTKEVNMWRLPLNNPYGTLASSYPSGISNKYVMRNSYNGVNNNNGSLGLNQTSGSQILIRDDSLTTAQEVIDAFNSTPLTFVYPLATPQTYQLTPQQIKTLVGTNNVWASSGDIVNIKFTYGGLLSELPSDATSIVGKCYCDVEQNGVSSMPFTLNVKKNERAT